MFAAAFDKVLESHVLPDGFIRAGIRVLLSRKLADESARLAKLYGNSEPALTSAFAAELREMPIAICTEEANQQHYEVPAEFYHLVLGPYKKYSSGLWLNPSDSLADAEQAMLDLYCQRAEIVDGQTILDCGCGWGSVSLYLAEKYPNSKITGLSNSNSQREWIMAQAQQRNLQNVSIQTGNITEFDFEPHQFDRIISIEMFEHMKNYELLFKKIARWIRPNGQLFVHIFTHHTYPYHFEDSGDTDWLTRYFFSGGTMPNHHLFKAFNQHLTVVQDWVVSGTHYEKTANAWLANLDSHRDDVMPILKATYGDDNALKWLAYWRIFFMACAELWGYRNGNEWQVSHYLLRPVAV